MTAQQCKHMHKHAPAASSHAGIAFSTLSTKAAALMRNSARWAGASIRGRFGSMTTVSSRRVDSELRGSSG